VVSLIGVLAFADSGGWKGAMELMSRRFEEIASAHNLTIIRVDSPAGKGSSIVVGPYW
jgi:hypothetical protein